MMPAFLQHPHSQADLLVPGKEHIELFLRLQNEPQSRQYLARYMPLGKKQEEEWVDKANSTPNDAAFVIALKDEQRTPVGSIGLHGINWKNRRAITGTAILEEHCNKGIGSHAKMLLLKWAFHELGLHKVGSDVIAFNGRSQAYGRKCGYVEVGRFKQHHFRNGEWHDEVIMEVYREPWEKLWKKFENGAFDKKRSK